MQDWLRLLAILRTAAIVQWSHPCKCQQPCHPCTPASPHCDREAAAAVRGAWECGQPQELHQLHNSLRGETAGCGWAGQARSETKAPWVSGKIPCQTLSGGLPLWDKWCRAASGNNSTKYITTGLLVYVLLRESLSLFIGACSHPK